LSLEGFDKDEGAIYREMAYKDVEETSQTKLPKSSVQSKKTKVTESKLAS
jgi:hypothetical protein